VVTSDAKTARVVAAAFLIFVAAVYLPDIGRGFVKDDFAWVAAGQTALSSPATIVQPPTPGFYRPLVTASFAVDYAFHQLDARMYGVTNLVLYVACVVLIGILFRAVGVSVAAAALGAFVWAVNPHGINMALVWISGRTALILTMFSAAAAIAFLRRWRIVGAILVLCALLSKEEAVALPFMIGALLLAVRRDDVRSIAYDGLAMAMAAIAYLIARSYTPAFTLADAPWYYAPTTDWRLLMRNTAEYLDRGASAAALFAVVMAALCRARPSVSVQRPLVAAAIAWFCFGFALTVWIPVRSSLYAVFPSIGAALACAVVLDSIREKVSRGPFERRVMLALAIVIVLIPVYRVRNDRFVEPARVSRRTMAAVLQSASEIPDRGTIELSDERVPLSNFRSAFGSLAPDAVRLFTGRPLSAYVATPDGERLPPVIVAGELAARFQLSHGQIVRVQ